MADSSFSDNVARSRPGQTGGGTAVAFMTDVLSSRLLRLTWAVVLSWIAVAGSIAVVGCGRGPEVAQVKGKVRYKDGTIPQAAVRVVRFEPKTDSTATVRKAASGDFDASDGSFELFTRRPGDGVYVGEYSVTFAVQKDPRDKSTSVIADKYRSSAQTPYHVSIHENVDDLEFEIEPIE